MLGFDNCTFPSGSVAEKAIRRRGVHKEQNPAKSQDLERAKTSELAVVWFYQKSHVEIQINKSCYSLYFGKVQQKRKITQFIEKGSPFVRFVLQAREDKIKALKVQLNAKKPKIPYDFCCGTVTHLINKYVSVAVPFLDSCTPTGLGYFLTDLSKSQNSPIIKIEHVGPSEDANLVSQLKSGEGKRLGVLFELVLGAILCAKLTCPDCCDCCDCADDNSDIL